LGFLGIVFPIILLIGTFFKGEQILPSISDYYYTSMNFIFTGVLFAISAFLFSYRGDTYTENLLTSLSSFFALIVSIFPTPISKVAEIKEGISYYKENFEVFVIPSIPHPSYVGTLHFIAAAIFFLLLSIIVIFIFVKSENRSTTPSKNRIILYRICGMGMFLSIIAIPIIKLLFPESDNLSLGGFPLTFSCETIALFLFGIVWLVKGEVETISLSKL